jgi:uncharacterized protein YuzE
MKITLDKVANAAYIYFKEIMPGEVVKTISLNDSINIDLDKEGKTLGIEIINATKNLPLSTLNSATIIN